MFSYARHANFVNDRRDFIARMEAEIAANDKRARCLCCGDRHAASELNARGLCAVCAE